MTEPSNEIIVDIIKNYLNNCDVTKGRINKIKINIEIFKFILTVPTFMCYQAKFRQEVKKKIHELRVYIGDYDEYNEDEIPYVNELTRTLKKVDIFFDKLKMRNDYVFYENEPRIVSTI